MNAITKWSQHQCTRDNVSKIERKEKIQKSSLHPSYTHSPYQNLQYKPSPYEYDYSHIKITLPFCHKWQRISTSSRHLIITGRASIVILISIIVVEVIVIVLRCLKRKRESNNETTHDSLSLCDTTHTGVHLTQLITECVKASIHMHKLCHDGLKCHSTRRRRRSKGGWSGRSSYQELLRIR